MLSGARDGKEDGKGNGKLASGAAVLTSATIKTASIERRICKWRWAAAEHSGECAPKVYAMSIGPWRSKNRPELERVEMGGHVAAGDGETVSRKERQVGRAVKCLQPYMH